VVDESGWAGEVVERGEAEVAVERMVESRAVWAAEWA